MARSKGKVIGFSFFGKPKKKTKLLSVHREHVSKSGDNAWYTSRIYHPTTSSTKRARRAERRMK